MELNKENKIANTLNNVPKEGYYVYALCEVSEDGKKIPFYIGKGKERRIFNHETVADVIKDKINNLPEIIQNNKLLKDDYKEYADELKKEYADEPEKEYENEIDEDVKKSLTRKYEKIIELKNNNKFEMVIVKWGLTENEAYMAESALINLYKFTNGEDSLTNIANGHRSKQELSNRAETTKARTVDEFFRDCAEDSIDINKLPKEIMLIRINKAFKNCEDDSQIGEATRGCWKIDFNRVKDKVKIVFGMYHSRIVGVYAVEDWRKCLELEDSDKDNFTKINEGEFTTRVYLNKLREDKKKRRTKHCYILCCNKRLKETNRGQWKLLNMSMIML